MLSHFGLAAVAAFPAGPGASDFVVSLVWAAKGLSHQSVVVFFVLSGFLIGGGVMTQAQADRRFFGRYLIDRTARIYIVLVPALLLTAALDALGPALFGKVGLYGLDRYRGGAGPVDFLGNLANLQDIYVPAFGSNGPLWSLSHEYWYYLTFGLVGVWMCAGYARPVRTAAFVAALASLAFTGLTPGYHLFGFLVWLAGAAAARLNRPSPTAPRFAHAVFLAAALGAGVGLGPDALEYGPVCMVADTLVALAFANLLLALRLGPQTGWRLDMAGWRKPLSDLSYSLYAAHLPLIVFVLAAAQALTERLSAAPALGWIATAVALPTAIMLVKVFWSQTEARTGALRAWAHRRAAPALPVREASPG